MKLLTLTLRNFQGVKDFTLDAQGKNVTIYGDNGAGKTTLASAWNWLLFDKDSLNRKDFEIKTLTPEGEALHGLEHEVEATLDIDGEELTLRKVYSEKWTKKRGSAQSEFSGHTTNHYLDGVPVSKRAYQDKIAEIADENIFRLLTDPRAFNENLHWADRRKVLLEVCGDVTDADVIASDPSLKELPKILGKKSLDDLKAMVKEQRAKVNRDLQQIPTRVSEVQRGLPDISQIKPEVLTEDIAKLRKLLEEKQAEKLRIEQGGEIAEKQKQLAQIETELLTIEGKHRRDQEAVTEESRNKHRAVRAARQNLELDIKGLEREQQSLNQSIREANLSLEALRDEWIKADAQCFEAIEYQQDDTCPTCGQALPAEQVEAAREKAREQFNSTRAENMEKINAKGKQKKAEAGELENQLAEIAGQLTKSQQILADLLTEEAKLQEQIDSHKPRPVGMNSEYARLAREKEHLQDAILTLKDKAEDILGNVNDVIDYINQDIATLEDAQAQVKLHAQAQDRIAELKAEERRLSKEYENLERQQYLCDEFTRAKVRMLDEKINSRFKLAKFRLFEEQINGGVSDTCVTLYEGVPWDGGLNNGAQIRVGCDIIRTLSQHYGLKAPVIIDNKESVTSLPEMDCQVISLVVSGADKKLRVEVEA